MKQGFTSNHWVDEDNNPAGGVAVGTGVVVSWQNGPLGRGEDRLPPNGTFVEDVIGIALDRLYWYQSTRFECDTNQNAILLLEEALVELNNRTADREKRKVEGTHEE